MDVEIINDAPEVLLTHLCCKVLQDPVVADAMFLAELQVKSMHKIHILAQKAQETASSFSAIILCGMPHEDESKSAMADWHLPMLTFLQNSDPI